MSRKNVSTRGNKIVEKDIEKGCLYIVGTPIGNLGDITYRAVETLKKVGIILAEDTRNTLKLLNYLQISKHMISYHRHNEQEKIQSVVKLLEDKKDIALVSDAGMPIISDPGYFLVDYLVKNGYHVEVIPGVTAFVTALVMSGINSTTFTFEGFLSVNKKQRNKRLESLSKETRTMIFYEAPHKILSTLEDMKEAFGERKICIARELTKIHEEYIYTTFEEAIKNIKENSIKGEIVLVIEGLSEEKLEEEKNEKLSKISIKDLVKEKMEEGFTKKEAIKQVAKLKSIPKNDVYKECLDL